MRFHRCPQINSAHDFIRSLIFRYDKLALKHHLIGAWWFTDKSLFGKVFNWNMTLTSLTNLYANLLDEILNFFQRFFVLHVIAKYRKDLLVKYYNLNRNLKITYHPFWAIIHSGEMKLKQKIGVNCKRDIHHSYWNINRNLETHMVW